MERRGKIYGGLKHKLELKCTVENEWNNFEEARSNDCQRLMFHNYISLGGWQTYKQQVFSGCLPACPINMEWFLKYLEKKLYLVKTFFKSVFIEPMVTLIWHSYIWVTVPRTGKRSIIRPHLKKSIKTLLCHLTLYLGFFKWFGLFRCCLSVKYLEKTYCTCKTCPY